MVHLLPRWIAENKTDALILPATRRIKAEHELEKVGRELRKMYSWNEEKVEFNIIIKWALL